MNLQQVIRRRRVVHKNVARLAFVCALDGINIFTMQPNCPFLYLRFDCKRGRTGTDATYTAGYVLFAKENHHLLCVQYRMMALGCSLAFY